MKITAAHVAILFAAAAGTFLVVRKSEARGRLPDPSPAPPITPGYLARPGDEVTVVASEDFIRFILEATPFVTVTHLVATVTGDGPPGAIRVDVFGYYPNGDNGGGATALPGGQTVPSLFDRTSVVAVHRGGVRIG